MRRLLPFLIVLLAGCASPLHSLASEAAVTCAIM
jgi:hypothetical protein